MRSSMFSKIGKVESILPEAAAKTTVAAALGGNRRRPGSVGTGDGAPRKLGIVL